MTPMDALLKRGYGEAPIRVRYAETDQMGVVYHANYLIWFEVGRVELMREMGVVYRDMEKDSGALIPVLKVEARYLAPARYDDELLIRTTLVNVRSSIIRFRYQVVLAADEKILCEGESVHMVVGRDMKRREIPPKYAEGLHALLAATKQSAATKSADGGEE
ncbi:MAG: thioesterase family protein [Bryocella sp.]